MTTKVIASEMENAIALSQTPEKQELEKKLAELAALETALAARELDFATNLAEIKCHYVGYVRSRQSALPTLHHSFGQWNVPKSLILLAQQQ